MRPEKKGSLKMRPTPAKGKHQKSMNMNTLKKLGLLALALPCLAGVATFNAPRPSDFLGFLIVIQ